VPAKRRRERKRLLVVAAFIERRGRVLLSQRRADQSFPMAWEFPGGKVEPGEDLVSALAREIREELDCTIRVKGIVDLVVHAYPDFDLIMPVYRATIAAGSPCARQVAAIAWVPRGQLAGMAMPPADVPLAKKLARTPARPRNPGTSARSYRRSARPPRQT
jgi:8-oxo-dGTP diphosphatase